MNVIKRQALVASIQKYPEVKEALIAWMQLIKHSKLNTPHDVKGFDPKASLIGNSRVVFNILGNRFRLIVKIQYNYGDVYIKIFGTHAEYDKVDAQTIDIFSDI